jgi:hypothetical protein
MTQPRTLTIAALRALIGLHHTEEKRIRAHLLNPESPQVRMQAEFDLEKLLIRIHRDEVELARLEAENSFVHQIATFGEYRSICRVCFQTVAKAARESRLVEGEEEHKCGGPPHGD